MHLAETIKLIEQIKHGVIDIIECGIEIGYRERMYYAQFGMFAIPPNDSGHKNLKGLHGMTFSIPSIDGDVYKCVSIPGQLLTNKYGEAQDWVLSPEGEGCAKRIMTPWPAGCH